MQSPGSPLRQHTGFSSYAAPQCRINCRSMGRILVVAAAILRPTFRPVFSVSVLLVPNVSDGIIPGSYAPYLLQSRAIAA
jgi:hypothetical protein